MIKRLYILRHGEATAQNYHNDAGRPLTENGIVQAQASGVYFREQQEALKDIFVSPYVRAQQTAEHFIEASGLTSASVQTNDLITPSGKPIEVALWLSQLKSESVLLVTHQPFAQQLLELLSDQPLPYDFAMTTGTLCALEGEVFATACCQFRWYRSP